MLPDAAIQEELSKAYIQAVASYAGYSFQHIDRDNDGVDTIIKSNSKPSPESILMSVSLEIQLKACCSNNSLSINENGDLVYDLKARNYNILVNTHRQLDIILVLLWLPEEKDQWLIHSVDNLLIKKCAYWVSLKGEEETNNTGTKRIVIPRLNVFSPTTLHEIMIKISKEEDLL